MTAVRLLPAGLPVRGSLAEVLPGVEWPFQVFVPGRAAPQGSKRALGPGRMVEMSKYAKPWREDVRQTALNAWACTGSTPCARCVDDTTPHLRPPLDGALVLEVEFVRARLATAPKTYTPAASSAPDLSKLVRSTEDALTSAGVWRDDSRVVAELTWKRFAEPDETPGAHIRIGVASELPS